MFSSIEKREADKKKKSEREGSGNWISLFCCLIWRLERLSFYKTDLSLYCVFSLKAFFRNITDQADVCECVSVCVKVSFWNPVFLFFVILRSKVPPPRVEPACISILKTFSFNFDRSTKAHTQTHFLLSLGGSKSLQLKVCVRGVGVNFWKQTRQFIRILIEFLFK
jgi:hypothetical protein